MNDDVENALKSDSALKSLISQRVYWIRPPNTPSGTYITYFEVTNGESESADDEEYTNDIEIQVDIWSKGSTIPAAKEVQRIMRKLGFTHQAMPDSYDKETHIFHKPIRFFIQKTVY